MEQSLLKNRAAAKCMLYFPVFKRRARIQAIVSFSWFKGELSGCHRLVQLLGCFFVTFWFHLYFLLSYHFFSHEFILPAYLKEKKNNRAAASPNSVRQRVLGCMSVCSERIRPQRLPSPVLLRWPFPLMGGSSQSRAKWCVRVCVLNREAEGESEHLSIISSAPTAKWRPKVRLFSCHSVMIHEIHLPESAPGCFGLWAKCRMWMQFVCVCVFTKQICFSVEADVAYFSSQQS